MFGSAECDVAYTTCVALGKDETYVLCYKKKKGTFSIRASANIPPGLSTFLFAQDSKGFLARDVANTNVSLGPNSSYWATDLKSSVWAGLPAGLESSFNNCKDAKGRLTTAFRCVEIRIDGNYILITDNNGASWNVSSYPQLSVYLDELKKANGNRGGALEAVKYIWLCPWNHSDPSHVILEANNNILGEVPNDCEEDAKAIIASIHMTRAASQARSASSGSVTRHAGLLRSVLGVAVGVAKVINATNTGSSGVSAGGFGPSVFLAQDTYQPALKWGPIQQAAQSQIQ